MNRFFARFASAGCCSCLDDSQDLPRLVSASCSDAFPQDSIIHSAEVTTSVQGIDDMANNVELSPLLIDDSQLAELPPTFVRAVDHDQLRDEEFIYVVHLKAT